MGTHLTDFMNGTISIVKQDGRRWDNIQAAIMKESIGHERTDIPVEEGDLYLRELPNGLVDTFVVIDSGFFSHPEFGTYYRSKVKKKTSLSEEEQKSASPSIVAHFHGSNARFNLHSTDNSQNYSIENQAELFAKLIDTVNQSTLDNKEEVLRKIEELKQAQGTPSYPAILTHLLGLGANVVTVLTPFLPQLSQLFNS